MNKCVDAADGKCSAEWHEPYRHKCGGKLVSRCRCKYHFRIVERDRQRRRKLGLPTKVYPTPKPALPRLPREPAIRIPKAYKPRSKRGYVYIMINPAWPDYVKIGGAVDLGDRLMGYHTYSPHRDYELVAWGYHSDWRRAEAALHEAFKAARAKGEWFKLSVAVATAMLAVVSEPEPTA
jgi:hypothetical protein